MYQQVHYHSLITGWKVLNLNNLKDCHFDDVNKGTIKLTKNRWSINTKSMYEKLHTYVINCDKFSLFKKRLKSQLIANIPIEEKD